MQQTVIRRFRESDIPQMLGIWNNVVKDGNAFPQEKLLNIETGREFFNSQSHTAVADLNGEVIGLYILHPNNVGRCSHICNASYAVKNGFRGMHIGEMLVRDSLKQGRGMGFKIMQFNAVVESNFPARALYDRLGFRQLGTIPGGFRLNTGKYENICLYFIEL